MGRNKDEPILSDDMQKMLVVAMSLGVKELQIGLDRLVTIAMITSSEDRDWDLLPGMGYDEYEIDCITAATAWIKRVTGLKEFDVTLLLKQRDRRK